MEPFQFLENNPMAWWLIFTIVLAVIFGILFWIFTVDNTLPSEKQSTTFFRRFIGRSFRRKPFPDNDNDNPAQRHNE